MFKVNFSKKVGKININTEFQVQNGEIFVILGSSGSGKTTILNMLAGLLKPDNGEIILGEKKLYSSAGKINLPPFKRRIGYVFQNSALFPHLTVKNNITYALPKKNDLKVHELLEKLELKQLANRYPQDLSGGEKQRVALARTLASDPQLLLFDEPFSALDIVIKEKLQQYVKQIGIEYCLPIIFVTHDLNEAKYLADSLNYLNNGKIKTLSTGSTIAINEDIYLNKICKYVV